MSITRDKIKLCLSMATLLFLCMPTMQVDGQQTVVSVSPSVSTAPTIRDKFTISVVIAHVVSLYGFELKLGYETTILDIINVDIQQFLNEPTYTVADETHEAEGWYWLAVTSWRPAEPKSGSGTLAKITFKVTGLGNCTLDVYDDIFVNSEGEEILHETIDGEFRRSGHQSAPFPVQTIVILTAFAIFCPAALYYLKKRRCS